MESNKVNNKVSKFMRAHNIDENVIVEWMSPANQEFVFGKAKKAKKNPYLLFRKEEIKRLKSLDPPITLRDELNTIVSDKWEKLKIDGGPEYDKYITDKIPTYEISKPFHKFSIDKRRDMEDEFSSDTSIQITERLVNEWTILTREEKKHWKID
jgi:hypothetical protein